MSDRLNRELFICLQDYDFKKARKLLNENPFLNINWKNNIDNVVGIQKGIPILHQFCLHHRNWDVMELLNIFPEININATDTRGNTALNFMCSLPEDRSSYFNNFDEIGTLLKHDKIDIMIPNHEGHTPLWNAAFRDNLKAIWILIWFKALGLSFAVGQSEAYDGETYTPFEIAVKNNARGITLHWLLILQNSPTEAKSALGTSRSRAFQIFKHGTFEVQKNFFELFPLVDYNDIYYPPGRNLLYIACLANQHETVALLLTWPYIRINKKQSVDFRLDTPLNLVCARGHLECLKLLLKDPRVDVNECDHESGDKTALWWAARCNQVGSVKWMIAVSPVIVNVRQTDLEEAMKHGETELCALLRRLMANYGRTKTMLCNELGYTNPDISKLFATVVYLCDDYVRLTNDTDAPPNNITFFSITRRVPMEIQMLICRRRYGSSRDIISSRDSDAAFDELGSILHGLRLRDPVPAPEVINIQAPWDDTTDEFEGEGDGFWHNDIPPGEEAAVAVESEGEEEEGLGDNSEDEDQPEEGEEGEEGLGEMDENQPEQEEEDEDEEEEEDEDEDEDEE